MNNADRQLLTHILQEVQDLKMKLISKEVFNGDMILDSSDVCEILHITEKTLRSYRQKGLISYYLMGGRIFYKSSEVNESLKLVKKRTQQTK